MNEISREQMEMICKEMNDIEKQHPKANVLYDFEKNRINITYPLPKDYFQIKQIKFIK